MRMDRLGETVGQFVLFAYINIQIKVLNEFLFKSCNPNNEYIYIYIYYILQYIYIYYRIYRIHRIE